MRKLPILVLLLAGLAFATGCPKPPQEEPAAAVTPVGPDGAIHVLVAFHSMSGRTERMAAAVAEGAGRIEGVTVTVKPAAQVTGAELERSHGLVLGCPTHYANVTGVMKTAIDRWAYELKVDLQDKVGGAFSTGGNRTGGKEHVVISLQLYMLNNRMLVVGPIYQEGPGGWGEIGASATTGADDEGLSDGELESARKLGERVARVARRWHG